MIRITKDHVADEFAGIPGDLSKSRVGFEFSSMPQYGMERAIGLDDSIPNDGYPMIPFQLWDDDGELMYEGELTDDPECDNQLAALRWGESDAGATLIKVLRDGEWKVEIG